MDEVQVRLVADAPEEIERAMAALTAALGGRIRFHRPGRPGRRCAWLAYGTLQDAGGAIGPSDGDARARRAI